MKNLRFFSKLNYSFGIFKSEHFFDIITIKFAVFAIFKVKNTDSHVNKPPQVSSDITIEKASKF